MENKEQALQKLTNLEASIKSATEEAQRLRIVIEKSNSPKNIMERVKTFRDACEMEGKNHDELLEKWTRNGDTPDEIAYKKLKIIVRVLNQGWIPNWKDGNQRKWRIWFNMDDKGSPSGFSFSGTNVDWANSGTVVGSRLCFKSEELARYCGTQFENIFEKLMVIED